MFEFLGKISPWPSLKHSFRMIHHVASLVGLYYFIAIFPIDFGLVNKPQLNELILFALHVAMLAVSVAIIVDAIKIVLFGIMLDRPGIKANEANS